ncbi:MAG: hypothetical protein IJU92_01450 [Spirochaetaceae bacterium]|nr:hypothetical protein [Spirochaetaceae bacterium]
MVFDKKKYNILLYLFFSFLIFSCGLDSIPYLEKPLFTHIQNVTDNQYLEFGTSDVENQALGGWYRGFTVLYRIYATKEACEADIALIERQNTSQPYNVATWLQNTKGYHFLKREPATSTGVLVPPASHNRTVRIRLFDYGTELKGLYIDNMNEAQVKRDDDDNSDFSIINLAVDVSAQDAPSDVQLVSSQDTTLGTDIEYRYVAFFAVTLGLDTHFSPLYSELLSLGWIELQ